MASTNGHESSDRLHQASGMVSVQAECTAAEAIVLMQEYAERRRPRLTLQEVAQQVVDRTLDFNE